MMRAIYNRFDGISAWKRSCLGNSEPQQWGSLLSEDEIAEVPMKTEQKKRKNTQNMRLSLVWRIMQIQENQSHPPTGGRSLRWITTFETLQVFLTSAAGLVQVVAKRISAQRSVNQSTIPGGPRAVYLRSGEMARRDIEKFRAPYIPDTSDCPWVCKDRMWTFLSQYRQEIVLLYDSYRSMSYCQMITSVQDEDIHICVLPQYSHICDCSHP